MQKFRCVTYLILKCVADYIVAMGGHITTAKTRSRVIDVVVLLLIALLVARISARESVLYTKQATLRYHHVHHALAAPGKADDADKEMSDHTSVPHHHDGNHDEMQHRHCHTHGIAHMTGDSLFFAGVDYTDPKAIARHGDYFTAVEKGMLSSYAAHPFRPPIVA